MKMIVVAVLLAMGALVGAQQGNIVQEAEKLGANELVKLVTLAGLTDTLANKGPFTVFAPTDEAFQRLPRHIVDMLTKNKTLLAEALEFHVLSGKVLSTDLKNDLVAPTLLTGKSVRANIYKEAQGNVVTIDGSRVVKADNMATNGVIHVIGKVLFPIPMGSVVDLVSNEKQLSTLLTAVKAANLAATLSGPGPFTVFAPTDGAFQRLPAGTLDGLLKNITALTDVLTYHVVKGTYYSAGLPQEADVPTVEGKSVHIKHQGPGHVEVNMAHVERPDIPVTNGVVHVIDNVLIPPKMAKP